MKNEEKRKGIWIPVELMENNELDWTNKILLAEICSLDELPDRCYGSNEYFGGFLKISKGAASKRITRLTSLGYIKKENVYKKGNCVGRIIRPIEKKEPASQKRSSQENQGVVPERLRGSSPEIQGVVPEQPEGGSSTTRGVVPEQPGGSSQTTRGVVPERLGGGSPENPINTINNTEILKEIKKEKTIKQLPEHNTGVNSEISSSSTLSNKEKSPKDKLREKMNEWFYDYPDWENDLSRQGLDKFILNSAAKYKTKEEDSIFVIKYFLSL